MNGRKITFERRKRSWGVGIEVRLFFDGQYFKTMDIGLFAENIATINVDSNEHILYYELWQSFSGGCLLARSNMVKIPEGNKECSYLLDFNRGWSSNDYFIVEK